MPLDKIQIRESNIAFVLGQEYDKIQSSLPSLSDELDDRERRAKIAKVFPPFAKLIESHTGEDLKSDLQFAAISAAVAKAIVWAETHPYA